MARFAPGTDPDYMNWFNVNKGVGGNELAARDYGAGNVKGRKKDLPRNSQNQAQTFNSNTETNQYGDPVDTVYAGGSPTFYAKEPYVGQDGTVTPPSKFNGLGSQTPDLRDQEDAPSEEAPEPNPSGTQPETGSNIPTGLSTLQDIMNQFFPMEIGSDDDGGRALKDGFALGYLQDYMNRKGSAAMAELDSALGKDNMRFGYYLNSMDKSNDRFENYIYGNMMSDRAYERQNQFANQQYGRDVGMLGAVGEQTRANMQEGGKQDRLGYMVQGEQSRLLEAARGDQARKSYDFQDRINSRTEGRQLKRASNLARSF
jgi:hypothetical protein